MGVAGLWKLLLPHLRPPILTPPPPPPPPRETPPLNPPPPPPLLLLPLKLPLLVLLLVVGELRNDVEGVEYEELLTLEKLLLLVERAPLKLPLALAPEREADRATDRSDVP